MLTPLQDLLLRDSRLRLSLDSCKDAYGRPVSLSGVTATVRVTLTWTHPPRPITWTAAEGRRSSGNPVPELSLPALRAERGEGMLALGGRLSAACGIGLAEPDRLDDPIDLVLEPQGGLLACRCGDEEDGFVWENGVMTDLGTLGGTYSRPSNLNDRGQIVGTSTTASGETHAVLWERNG
jgi:probable HAF family extracellular repeat protein